MSTVDAVNVSKRTLKMAERRNIDTSKIVKGGKFDSVRVPAFIKADELIGKLEELAHEHCGGDFSQIEVCAEAQAGFEKLYGQVTSVVEDLYISLDFHRDETDEEATRRFINDFDKSSSS